MYRILNVFISLKIVCVLANSVHPDEMPRYMYVAVYLGLHCLPNYEYTTSWIKLLTAKFRNRAMLFDETLI